MTCLDTASVGTRQSWGFLLVVTGDFLQLVFFSSPVQEMLLHQDGLKQMVINNYILQREILRQREVSELGKSRRSAAEPAILSPCPSVGLFCLSGVCCLPFPRESVCTWDILRTSRPAGISGSLLEDSLYKGCFQALLFAKSLKKKPKTLLLLLQSKELLEI